MAAIRHGNILREGFKKAWSAQHFWSVTTKNEFFSTVDTKHQVSASCRMFSYLINLSDRRWKIYIFGWITCSRFWTYSSCKNSAQDNWGELAAWLANFLAAKLFENCEGCAKAGGPKSDETCWTFSSSLSLSEPPLRRPAQLRNKI